MSQILILSDELNHALNLRTKLQSCHLENMMINLNLRDPEVVSKHDPDLILLAVSTRSHSLAKVCKEIRSEGIHIPILAIAKDFNLQELVNTLEAGADQYISFTATALELCTKVNSLLRRPPKPCFDHIQVGELLINPQAKQVTCQGMFVELREREFAILAALAREQGRPISRRQLNLRTSQTIESDETVIDVHVSNIRKKLKAFGMQNLIQTVYGFGYKIATA